MTVQPSIAGPAGTTGGDPPGRPPFFRSFWRLAGPYWRSERRRAAYGLTLIVVVLTVAQVATPVAINLWSERLFDALEQLSLIHI